jgi:hypothetical protein
MAKPKTKPCDQKVRKGAQRVPCGTPLSTGDFGAFYCKNSANHISKIKTGFCNAGFCEGTKSHDSAGKPAKTCGFILTCPCSCHDVITKMFELSGMERLPQENPEYKPPKRDLWLHNLLENGGTSIPSNPEPIVIPPGLEGATVGAAVVSTVALPAVAPRAYQPTVSGRSARGELEFWVKRCCDYFVLGDIDTKLKLTPQRISQIIADEEGIKAPSTGAIDAVFKRWEKLGFAKIERKPTRFVAYTEDGIKYGLDGLKRKVKFGQKLQSASAARTIRH